MNRFFASLLILLLIAGCVSERLYGISSQEWVSYSPEKQQEIMEGYQKIASENDYESQEAVKPTSDDLLVRVFGGQVKMPPFTNMSRFLAKRFRVPKEQCVTVKLQQRDGETSIPLTACFKNNVLYVDASKYIYDMRKGSVRFQYSPIWNRGFTYKHVDTKGYAGLKDVYVSVYLKKYTTNDQEKHA